MLRRRIVQVMAVAAFVAVVVIAGLMAFGPKGAARSSPAGVLKNEPINALNLPSVPIAPLDPSFTGGPPLQPNMGTKPPSTSAKP